jgi:hypothetical protein
MYRRSRAICPVALLLPVLAVTGCKTFSSYNPEPHDQVAFHDRVETQSEGDVTVSVSVLTAEEAKEAYGVKLYKKRIQPIWLEVENGTDQPIWFLPRGVDPDYVSALEAAYRSHWTWNKKANRAMDVYFFEQQMPFEIPAHSSVAGFVLGTRNKGARLVVVDVVGNKFWERFEFLVEIPGFKADYLRAIESQDEILAEMEIVDVDQEELRRWIDELPCCTANAKGTKFGDPLNLVIIGDREAIWPAFLRAGWDLTSSITTGSALKTGLFGVFGGAYRYAPISSLYVFGRPQDIALQKVRHNIHLRNHLRLWLAPITFRGKEVWVGQISRDIGTRLTSKSSTLTTHKIDPDVDETRSALLQDFVYTRSIGTFAYAKGVGAAPPDEPRGNLTGDPYFTDGLRAVMLLTAEPTSVLDIEYLRWEEPLSR